VRLRWQTQVSTNFHRKVATIDNVTKKQVSRVLWMTPNVKKLHQVIVLAVNIATNYAMINLYLQGIKAAHSIANLWLGLEPQASWAQIEESPSTP
jgi:hypothetical protein